MLKQAVIACLTLAAPIVPALAQEECKAEFALVKGSGEFTALNLYRFESHYELQAETPTQRPLDAFAATIDGEPAGLHFSLGIDDLLVVMSTHQSDLEVSPGFLKLLSQGKNFMIFANANGNAVQSEFSLKGSAAAIERLRNGCR